MRRAIAPLIVVAALGLVLLGCSSGSKKASSTDTTTATTAPASTSTSTTTTPSTTGTVSSTHCASSVLIASIGATQSGAGQRYTALIITNTGSMACDLKGFPGVSLLDSSANQIGQPATREGAEGATVTLEPGGTASATLHTTGAGLGPACDPASAQVKIYPPDNTVAILAPASFTACGGFSVTTLVPGSNGN
jgi:hypothetical protein